MLLNTMLRWATTVREPNGERRVKENLLAGLRRPRESKPKRPIATWERFLKTRAAMQALAREATMAHRTGALAQDGVVAEARAELPKLAGGLWHLYRRKWATERKHLPLKDVAAAGGWRDVETRLECYQQPDVETLRAVMEGDRKLHDPRVGPEKRQQKRQLHVG